MKMVFTTGQVAKICEVAPRTVSKWFDTGKLKGYRIPGSQDRRIAREDLITFLQSNGMPLSRLLAEISYRILLVATDQDLNDQIKQTLATEEQYLIQHAANDFDAGTSVGKYEPHAIIIDQNIGRPTMIQIAYRLRTGSDYAGTFLVALANEDEPDMNVYPLAGFDLTYRKPASVLELCQALREHAKTDPGKLITTGRRNPPGVGRHDTDCYGEAWVRIRPDEPENRSRKPNEIQR